MNHEMDAKLLQQLIDEMDGGDFDDVMKGAMPPEAENGPVHGATVVEITVHPHGKDAEKPEEMPAEEDEELPADLKDILG